MKNYKMVFLSALMVIVAACDLNKLDDPNAVKLNQTSPSLLLNNIQIQLASFYNTSNSFGAQVTRLRNAGGSVYENFANPQAYDGMWTTGYANLLKNCDALIKQADENSFTAHAGITRIITAYVLSVMVDYFGDVPYSGAFAGLNNFTPNVDKMTDLYPAIIKLLNDGAANLRTPASPIAPAITDFYYGGNLTKWIELSNTIELKMFLNLRLVDANAATQGIAAALSDPAGVITTQDDNFVYRYATNTADPDVRHPNFVGNYITGAGDYMSNYLMWQMFHGYDRHLNAAGPSQGDPRMRFYFYRQRGANSSDPNEIRCVAQVAPPHYPFSTGTAVIPGKPGMPPGINPSPTNLAWGRTFCFPTPIGYWGREHVDPQGIPPDGLARTAWGAYPVGGRFDANVNGGVNNPSLGMRGAGMEPIMMRAFVNFMLAEADLYLTLPGTLVYNGVTVEGGAATLFQNGIRASMQDVRDWAVNGTYGTNPNFGPSPNEAATINTYYPAATYTTDVTSYVTAAAALYTAQGGVPDASMNIVAREYWIASFANGIEAYNLYRRTGLPAGMQPTVNPTPGAFPRTFWYPAAFATRNQNITQKSNLSSRLFWDQNNINLDF